MIKTIKRTTDNKFLHSLETDTWVDDAKDAFEMTYRECEITKAELLNTYAKEQIVEIVNMFKNKPISRKEKKELLDLLRNK